MTYVEPSNSLIDSVVTAKRARRRILQMAHAAQASHVASGLSVVDILAVLYTGAAKVSPETVDSIDRDYIILSKGHAAAALYSVLAIRGFFSESQLELFCKNGSNFGGHATHHGKPGVELSTGSLGHGLPYGLGIAFGQKLSKSKSRTFIVMSDGECDEGTTWESALMAQQYGLDNIVVIIDRNRIQSLAATEDTIALEPFAEKWEAFNWEVRTVDGHSHSQLEEALSPADKPLCIIAETTKGKGVSFMENSVLWHYRPPSDIDLQKALQEVENGKE